MGFTKYSLCETYCQGSSEISFIHLNIDDLFYKYYSPVIEHQYTFEIVESFLEKNCLLDLSGPRQEGLEIFWGPKDISSLDDDPPGKSVSKIRDDQPDLERSDNKFFSRNDSTMSKVC